MRNKKLYKSRDNKMICGICGGIGEYFSIDPTIVRLIMVFLGITQIGIVAYLIAAVIVPYEYE